MATVRLDAVYIGQAGPTGIYRIDLSQSGLASIGAIAIHDDNILSGGTASHSGFDLDFVKISKTAAGDALTARSLVGESVFDFTHNGVVFQPGFQTPLAAGDPPEWNTSLQGTTGANVYDPGLTTFGVADAQQLSLGEGGQVTFLFRSGLASGGRYLYFGDNGGNGEGAYVLVSDQAVNIPNSFTLMGTPGHDVIRIGVGANAHLLYTDTIAYGRRGNDKIYGAFGNDWLYGEAGNDRLSGGGGNDRLYGGSGNDYISGGAGNDWIFGGTGNDRLQGEGGRDTFVFNTKPSSRSNMDRILDFNVKYDSIALENSVFTKVGSGSQANPKTLKKSAFWTGSEAHDSNDRIIYDKKSGALYYDRDGTGDAAQVKFAQLSKGLKLAYHDFFVI